MDHVLLFLVTEKKKEGKQDPKQKGKKGSFNEQEGERDEKAEEIGIPRESWNKLKVKQKAAMTELHHDITEKIVKLLNRQQYKISEEEHEGDCVTSNLKKKFEYPLLSEALEISGIQYNIYYISTYIMYIL